MLLLEMERGIEERAPHVEPGPGSEAGKKHVPLLSRGREPLRDERTGKKWVAAATPCNTMDTAD